MAGGFLFRQHSFTGNRENLEIRYKQAGSDEPRFDEEWFLERLAAYHEEDAKFCHTSVGPHRDDLTFFMNGMDISIYGSQGQQRSIVLALKLAEAQILEEACGEKPVILLDDVMSELDEHRRHALVEFISGDMQTFITTANLAYFDDSLLKNASVVQLGEEAKRG